MIALFFIADLVMFSHGYYVHLFPQLAAPVIVAVMVYPYRYFVEEKMRRKVQKVFGYYIDKRVLDTLVEKDSEALLAGESRKICIFFLDIRGFTQRSPPWCALARVQYSN